MTKNRSLIIPAVILGIGAVAALALTKFLRMLLFNVSPHDPRVFAAALGVMTVTTISACLLPAWRASRTDPARVLRD